MSSILDHFPRVVGQSFGMVNEPDIAVNMVHDITIEVLSVTDSFYSRIHCDN